MKALLFVGGWLAVGAFIAARRFGPGTGPVERALALLFWPFFIGQHPPPPGSPSVGGPIGRLRSALGDGDAAQGLVAELAAAVDRLAARHARIEAALADLGPPGEGAVAEAREASRMMLIAARDRAARELDGALAAIEEAATRLYLAREAGERGEVEDLLRALKARLSAGEELAAD